MLILVWFVVCIIFAFVQYILGDSVHSLELFALLAAIALFLLNKLTNSNPIPRLEPVIITFFIK